MQSYVSRIVKEAKKASYLLAGVSADIKDRALQRMAKYLLDNREYIFKANRKDLKQAVKDKLKESFIDRLTLDEKRLKEMRESLREIAGLPSPVGSIIDGWQSKGGFPIQKVRVPIGVIFMIYEARPNVTSDSIGLLFKSSNAAILRGGAAAINSNKAIAATLRKAVRDSGINFDPFFIIDKPEYKIVDALLRESNYIDLVIPRGGQALIKKVVKKSQIPVIKHYKGVCHIFVDKYLDMEKALKICLNAKVQRPSVCNAVETILVHKDIASKFLPKLKKELDKSGVQIRAGNAAAKILKGVRKAKQQDWSTEYLDLIVSIKVVKNLDEAIAHINCYGSHHTDSIVTENIDNGRRFTKEVDSACCFVNISTRFSDGYQFGLGAEIGISTDKLHARGPMGLSDLTTYKYVAYGDGQVRE
ncbi:MAG: glutamate-5-semialdehyde dehydrogenase [Candidatus Omnitrophota bacterium]|nr:MAG: glutamate-5-semialdehyde dehydrogenase [Candidatus Omnitrophota bacterium]